jgi:dipeptidyl aminopeptidase/acylaminoacyl peptidase
MRYSFPLLCAGLVLAGAAAAGELPVSDFAKHPTLTNPVLSPDGKYLAVAVSQNTDSTDADYQLAVFSLPELKVVSRLDMAFRNVPIDIHWVSPKRLIMMVGEETGTLEAPGETGDIIAVDYDGSHKRLLYSLAHRGSPGSMFDAANYNLLSAPRGLPSIAGVPEQPNGHFFMNLQLFPPNMGNDFDVSTSQLYDVDTATGHTVEIGEIAHGNMRLLPHDGVARIAFGEDDHLETEAFSSADGRHWTRIPDKTVGKYYEPLKISADGQHLYALSSMDGGPNALVDSNLDGSDRKVLASDPFASVSEVLFEPQTNVPYAAVFTAQGRPFVKEIGDDIYAKILDALAKTDPADFVDIAGASTDGSKLLVHVEGDRNPGVYALLDRNTMHARPLYEVLPWIDSKQMPARMPVHFAARDGTPLVGYLTLPLGNVAKNLPLVLIPHGGPIGPADEWFFDPWAAFLANRGYATLQVNYRGSGGRGRNFEHSGYKQFGNGIQDDLVDGVKWAIAQGYVDPNRICVFGASFGGYSSLMQPMVAPGLYKCAMDYAGVYDWRINFDRSDTSHVSLGRTYFADAIGDRDEAYKISPANMLDKFNVPVLIVHGKDDPRVPYQNATDLRSALDKAGKPYEWLVKPKELHGFYAEKNNEELFTTMQAFLTKYIGAGDTPPAPPKGN